MPVATIKVGKDQKGFSLTNRYRKNGVEVRELVIRDKKFVGVGTPGIDGPANAISVNARLDTILLENLEAMDFSEGFTIMNAIEVGGITKLTLRNCYIHDIYDGGSGGPHKTRAQALFTSGVQQVELIDCFFENIGHKPGVDVRDIFSHGIYAEQRVPSRYKITRGIFNNCSSHCINGNEVELDGVICANSAIHFGVKKTIGTPSRCYSVNLYRGRLGEQAPRGWHWYDWNSLADHVKVVEGDPINWPAVRAAAPGERFALAESYLLGKESPDTPEVPSDEPGDVVVDEPDEITPTVTIDDDDFRVGETALISVDYASRLWVQFTPAGDAGEPRPIYDGSDFSGSYVLPFTATEPGKLVVVANPQDRGEAHFAGDFVVRVTAADESPAPPVDGSLADRVAALEDKFKKMGAAIK